MAITEAERDKEYRTLVALTRIHHSIGALLDLEEIARILVREIKGIVSCDGCAILLIEKNRVNVMASLGLTRLFPEGQISPDAAPIRYLVTSKQDIVSGNVPDGEFAACIPPGEPIKSLLCTPIIIEDTVRGIIHLDSVRPDAFTADDVEFVRLLANEVAVAFERSFLFSEIKDISVRDGLTGCYNRRKFDIDIVAAVADARKSTHPLSLLMIDIDWFKMYNDFHGHQKGDYVLKKLVQVMRTGVRPLDGVYRYGGEEFAVILPEVDKDRAVIVAERLKKVVVREKFDGEEPSQPEGKLTISVGVADFPNDASKFADLIRASDTALYQAKNEGRNRVRVYEKRDYGTGGVGAVLNSPILVR